jgi:putative hydrolase of the HAD superfamily
MFETKAVIFDLWETLGTKNSSVSKTFSSRFNISASPQLLPRYEAAIQLKKWESEEDAAVSLLTEFNVPTTHENITFVADLIRQGIQKATIFPNMKNLLQEFHHKYKLGILSNTTNFESNILSKWGIDELFAAKVFSWEVGSLKPDAKNFEIISSKLYVKPSECLFVDDSQVNVDASVMPYWQDFPGRGRYNKKSR